MKKQLITTLVGILLLTSCKSSAPKNQYRSSTDDRPLVDDKYSLTADRKSLEELRSEVPEERRKENDELALILQMTTEVKRNPSEIRSEFDKIVRKKREIFDRDLKKERENFTKAERKSREEFLRQQSEQKDTFKSEKRSRDENQKFYRDLDAKRTEHFSNEREKRADFESDIRERRKSFEDYIRSKTNEFNQEHRAYVKKYEEWKKQEREKQREQSKSGNGGMQVDQPVMPKSLLEDLMELDSIRSQPGTNLESGQ